jgi:hypothetical protein
MTCKGCDSNKLSIFTGETAIHFPGREGLDKSLVFVFPKLVVCFHCGFTEFTVPERELRSLERGSPVDGAAVLTERVEPAPGTKRRSTSLGMDS